jgi:hypothetical protein
MEKSLGHFSFKKLSILYLKALTNNFAIFNIALG